MKHAITLLTFLLLTVSCYDDDDNLTGGICYDAVQAGDNFVLGGQNVTVLSLESDLWCVCCELCDCYGAPLAILLIEGDTVRVGGAFFSPLMQPQVGEYNGRTITMDELNAGTCENRLEPEDFSACFSID